MGDELGAMVRTGMTVILVAALITTVLNLMSVSDSFLNKGTANLESGVAQIDQQQYRKYDQGNVSGTGVKVAIQTYGSSDMAIVVQTKLAATNGNKAYNYGTTLVGFTASSGATPVGNVDTSSTSNGTINAQVGASNYVGEYAYDATSKLMRYLDTRNLTQTGTEEYIRESARFESYLIKNASEDIVGIFFKQVK